MEAIASVKMQRISPRKARLVADIIRRKPVSDALSILEQTNKKATHYFIKLINAAIANAVNNHGADAQKLFVSDVQVNSGPTLKRFQPRSQGRAYSILKRTSHMFVIVSDDLDLLNKKATKKSSSKKLPLRKTSTKSDKVNVKKALKNDKKVVSKKAAQSTKQSITKTKEISVKQSPAAKAQSAKKSITKTKEISVKQSPAVKAQSAKKSITKTKEISVKKSPAPKAQSAKKSITKTKEISVKQSPAAKAQSAKKSITKTKETALKKSPATKNEKNTSQSKSKIIKKPAKAPSKDLKSKGKK